MTCLVEIKNEITEIERYIDWCGKKWWVRNGKGAPGDNYWSNSENNVFIDSENNLHLKIKHVNDIWYCSEVDSADKLSYFFGEYKWTVKSAILNLDPNIVAAMFYRYNDNNEIDVEATLWGMAGGRLEFSVHPKACHSVIPYDSPYKDATNVTYSFIWNRDSVSFTVALENGTIIENWVFSGIVPKISGGVSMSMWLMNHLAPIDGQEAEMVLTNFTYTQNWKEIEEYNNDINLVTTIK